MMSVGDEVSLNLMYITNSPDVAKVIEQSGVDRIFVDMEVIGKAERQRNMHTVQSSHTFSDIEKIRKVISKAELMVRCNPVHDQMGDILSTEQEIDRILAYGADYIMLPYFKTLHEVERFLRAVDGRTKTILLVETPGAVDIIDDILALDNFDELYIGLNDLSLGYKMQFMFGPLANGVIDALSAKIRAKGIPFGFGGIASLSNGKLPSEYVIKELYRLGASSAILSRSFCNANEIDDIHEIKEIFDCGIAKIREYEQLCAQTPETWEDNHKQVIKLVNKIVGKTT